MKQVIIAVEPVVYDSLHVYMYNLCDSKTITFDIQENPMG